MAEMLLKLSESYIAKKLSETLLIREDLKTAISVIEIWHETASKPSLDEREGVICTSLFRDSVTQFIGCFDRTAKFPLDRDKIYSADDGGHDYFQWLQDVRDAYAAHQFGALRQCVVGPVVDDESNVVGIGEIVSIYRGPVSDAGPEMKKFMEVALRFTEKELKSLAEKLDAECKALGKEKISKLSNARVYGLDPHEIRSSRPAIQRTRSESPPTT